MNNALTREQVEKIVERLSDNYPHLQNCTVLLRHDAALRQTIAQQAQEVESWKRTAHAYEQAHNVCSQQLATLQATLAAREAKYQKTISESIDQIDLQCDEFNRIKAITDNEEIKGICDRAVRDIGQRVPVIQQRDAAMQDAARLREALRFYADPQTYGISGGTVDRIIQDAGKQAQRALKGA